MYPDDTICAIATAPGGAARGMVRVSGPDALAVAARLFQPDDGAPLEALTLPTAAPGHLHIDLDTAPRQLPCDLFLWPTSRSYTRQPVAELHTFGSPPLLEAVLAAVCRAGARLAEPGEFTLRAFLSGRLDLTQAEAVLGVIDARGPDELNGALTQLAGGLARPLHQLRDELIGLLADIEAGLDFVEEDIEFVSSQEVLARLDAAAALLDDVAKQMAARHTARHAARVALVGPPNAGKSSLFNALVSRSGAAVSPALVSPQRGTTRDYLTAAIDLDGLRCELIDTAGFDETAHAAAPIDAAAQSLAAQQRSRATMRILCIDSTDAADYVPSAAVDCELLVFTKTDLAGPPPPALQHSPRNIPVLRTSSRTAQGLDELHGALRKLLMNDAVAQHGQVVAATADRCRESIRLAAESLQRAAETARHHAGDELLAAELRTTLSELGKVVGAVYTDDILDRIFSTFCIGK